MKLKVKCFICFATLLFMYLSVKNWNYAVVYLFNNNIERNKNKPAVNDENVTPDKEVSLVFRYTHETSKHLIHTVNSFLVMYPNMPIILVSDANIPQELMKSFSKMSHIKNVPLKLDLLRNRDRKVANYIKTRYVLIAPNDIVSLTPDEILKLIKTLSYNKKLLIALPVEKRTFTCLKLKLNLVQWSVQYIANKYGPECDSVRGDHAVFMHSKILQKIEEPFMLPFPEAFYIQTTALKLKVKPIFNFSLKSKQKHNKKIDFTQKYRLQKQIMNKLFKIKKVVMENGVTEWYGCTRKTPRCFSDIVNSVPDYLNQGRWTPPCCLKVLREVVHHVFKVLKEWNVTFWLEGGSLLGAMRTKDIIPWDYDVDIGMYLEEVNKCPWLRAINQESSKKETPSIVDNKGFVWEKAKPEEGDFYRVQASESNHLHVDIFPFYSKNGIMTKKTWFPSHPQDMEFPEHYLKPLTTVEFAGIEAPAPNNVKEFLELKFGKGCVENPQYPNPKLFKFPDNVRPLVVNETYIYDSNFNYFN